MTTEPRGDVAATTIEPVIKEVVVPLDREHAFELFTDRVATWWPLASHSVAGERAVACAFEPRVGGRFFETAEDGTEQTWGTVQEWQPPARIVLTWHAGRTPATQQLLEVTFESRTGQTRVRLVHTGWENLGDVGPQGRDDYQSGWDFVLRHFTDAASR